MPPSPVMPTPTPVPAPPLRVHLLGLVQPKAMVADPKAMGGLSAFMATTLGTDNKSGSGRNKKVVIAPHGAH